MKKFVFIGLFILLVASLLLTLGIVFDYLWLIIIAGVFFGIYIIGMALIMFRIALKRTKEIQNSQDKQSNQEELIEELNNTKGLRNRDNYVLYRVSNLKNTWKSTTRNEKALIIFLSVTFILGFAAIITLMLLGLYLPMGIVLGALFIIIGVTIIVSHSIAKKSLAGDEINYMEESMEGTVESCYLIYDKTSTTRGVKLSSEKTEVKSVIYKLKVNLNGKMVVTYSNKMYNDGETVHLRKHKSKKRVYIIEE